MGETTLYATGIREAAARGNLDEMKKLVQEAEQLGDISAALELLKLEIAKLEARS